MLPPGDPERDCTPVNRLYGSMGFQELDRLVHHPQTLSDVLDPIAYVQGVGGFSGSESSRSSLRSQPISVEESASGADDSDGVSVARSRAVS